MAQGWFERIKANFSKARKAPAAKPVVKRGSAVRATREAAGRRGQPGSNAQPARTLPPPAPQRPRVVNSMETTTAVAAFDARQVGDYVLRVAFEEIGSETQLMKSVSFDTSLAEEIGLSSWLYKKLSPLLAAPNSKQVILLCTPDNVESAEMVELLRVLHRKGYSLAEGLAPNVFVTPHEALILSVSNKHITGDEAARRKRVLSSGSDGALWKTFLDVIEWAVTHRASDIHLNINSLADRSQIRFTIDGQYVGPEQWLLPTQVLSQIASVAYQQSRGGNGADFNPQAEQSCRIHCEVNDVHRGKLSRVMLRWGSLVTDDGPQITLRPLMLDSMLETYDLAELGYLDSQIQRLKRVRNSEGGAIVASGVVGSGKSTLLATLLSDIPASRKLMTLEDPREYVIRRAHQITLPRRLDSDDSDMFLPKIRNLKRSAYNDLMVGEVRDRQTGALFQDALDSGHNVYTTVHARRAHGIPERFASPSVGIDRTVLATPGALKLLICQVLLPKNCPHCAIPVDALTSGQVRLGRMSGDDWKVYMHRVEALFAFDVEHVRVRNPEGCEHCRREGLPELSGYKGRTVAAEMIEPDDHFLEMLRDSRNIELERYVSSQRRTPITDPDDWGKSMLEVAMYHVARGVIDPRAVEPRFESFETMELRRKVAVQLRRAA